MEAVADPGFGEDELGFGGVGFELFAELVDHDAEVFGLFAVVGPPVRRWSALPPARHRRRPRR